MSTRTKQTFCRSCSHLLDAVTPLEDGRLPSAGDFSICAYCGTVSRFDAEMNLTPATPDDLVELSKSNPVGWVQIKRAAYYIRQRIAKN